MDQFIKTPITQLQVGHIVSLEEHNPEDGEYFEIKEINKEPSPIFSDGVKPLFYRFKLAPKGDQEYIKYCAWFLDQSVWKKLRPT